LAYLVQYPRRFLNALLPGKGVLRFVCGGIGNHADLP
jgi:hypothetical protein